jgi:hypothetical protein
MEQLFGIRTAIAVFRYVFKYGFGSQQGDGFRLPGVVIIKEGKLVHTQRQKRAYEGINWNAILDCKTC